MVQITDYREGRVTFRGISGEYLRKPLRNVEWLAIERSPSLTLAERFARHGDFDAAWVEFNRAAAEAGEGWVRDLILARQYQTAERNQRLDRAVDALIRLVRDNPRGIVGVCRGPATQGLETTARAIDRLVHARDGNRGLAENPALNEWLLALLLFEGREVPADFAPASIAAAPHAADDSSASDSAGETPPLFAAPVARRGAGSPRVRLSEGSWLLDAATSLLEAGRADECARIADAARAFVGQAGLAPWRVVRARARMELGDPAWAAQELIGIAESAPSRSMRAEALYHAGLAHEKLGRPEVAARLYAELLGGGELTTEQRERVATSYKRVTNR